MSSDLEIFRRLLRTLWEFRTDPWDYSDNDLKNIYNEIADKYLTFANDKALEKALPSEEHVRAGFTGPYVLYLNPTEIGRPCIPILGMECDFGRSIPKISLKIAFLCFDQDSNVRSIGFRFETPEDSGSANPGIHNYYHTQLITGFKKDVPFTNTEHQDWLPVRQPAIPLNADNPAKLILCILISLYGVRYVGKLRTEAGFDRELSEKITNYLAEMNMLQTSEYWWYWKVGVGNPIKSYEYYRTKKNPDVFNTEFRAQKHYAKCELSGITKSNFDEQNDNEKREF